MIRNRTSGVTSGSTVTQEEKPIKPVKMAQEGSFEKILTVSRNAFNGGKTRSLSFRAEQLKRFIQMVQENIKDFQNAVFQDLKKHKLEVSLYELESLIHEAKFHLKNLKSFASPDKLPFNLLTVMDSGSIEKCPYGVVLILGAWNYPILLSLQPVVGAIAAGNCVIIKPSEVAPHTASLMAKIFPKYMDNECYHVVEAGPEETQQLLTNKFDYVFYTGSTNVGKLVMQACANHLTPSTLELGGKSPCYIDDNSDLEIATKRVLWGRFSNSGQTCVAPDYLLCSKKIEPEIIRLAGQIIEDWYKGDPQKDTSYSRVVNEKHCMRLKRLLDTTRGKIIIGGNMDLDDLYCPPTIVVDVTGDDPLMQEEIFGPILPIVSVNSHEEAIEFINSKSRPLALYCFSKNSKVTEEVKDKTISGGVCINDTMWHAVWNGLPFGGVGDSGMGSYHGKTSFDTFSHHRSVLKRSFSPLSEKLGEARYPPYTDNKMKLFTFIIRNFLKFNFNMGGVISHLFALLVGAAIAVGIYYAIGK